MLGKRNLLPFRDVFCRQNPSKDTDNNYFNILFGLFDFLVSELIRIGSEVYNWG